MRFLILGGTGWLGGHVARTAIERGHHVTCLARGISGVAPDGARLVAADRDADDAYQDVVGETAGWDVVVDVASQPGRVRRATGALAPSAGRYLFVSTGSVYAHTDRPWSDESAELLPPLDGDVMESMASYGSAKVSCERHALTAFGPERTIIARAGLIGGPGDTSGRTGYWPLRFARPSSESGSVLVPDAPDAMTQVIDVRDMADWCVRAGEQGVAGVFNVVGEPIPLDRHLETARQVAGHHGPLVKVDQRWLEEHGVGYWMGLRSLPLWLPLPQYSGWTTRDGGAARRAGLTYRPLSRTLADVLAWELTQPDDVKRGAGLTDEEERALLRAAI